MTQQQEGNSQFMSGKKERLQSNTKYVFNTKTLNEEVSNCNVSDENIDTRETGSFMWRHLKTILMRMLMHSVIIIQRCFVKIKI